MNPGFESVALNVGIPRKPAIIFTWPNPVKMLRYGIGGILRQDWYYIRFLWVGVCVCVRILAMSILRFKKKTKGHLIFLITSKNIDISILLLRL